MASVLVLAAHPDLRLSRANRLLLTAARGLQNRELEARTPERRDGDTLEVRDLYALYPDYLIDVHAEQQALARADLIVWQHPVHWYAMPPLMKLWVDDVLTLGWAYGRGPQGPATALRGKDLWLVASTGGPSEAYRPDGYNGYFFDAFLPPYEQTAALCGLRFLPPLLLHGAHGVSDEQLAQHAARYRERLASYPAWAEKNAVRGAVPAYEVPVADRTRGTAVPRAEDT